MREKKVRDEDRLGATKMCVRGHQSVARTLRLCSEFSDERRKGALQFRNAAPEVQAQINSDLFVSRPPGMEATTGVADTLHEFTLDECVDVFVAPPRLRRKKRGIRSSREDLSKPACNRRGVRRVQNTCALEGLRPRKTALHIIFEEPPVEPEGGPEVEQRGVGISLKSA